MITLPENFISGLISTMGGTISDLMPLILLIAGAILGIYIISSLIWSIARKVQENKK